MALRSLPDMLAVTPTKPKPMSESDLLAAVLSLAKLYGWRTLHIRPARTEKGWRSPVQGDGRGFPDLLMARGTDLLAVELKSETGVLTKDQLEWLRAIAETGIETAVWRPAAWENGIILATLRGGPGGESTPE